MIQKVLLRSELVQRANLKPATLPEGMEYTIKYPSSQKWADARLNNLDLAKKSISKIQDAFKVAIHNWDHLTEIKSQLAYIPIHLILCVGYETKDNGLTTFPYTKAYNDDYSFKVGTDACPYSMFPQSFAWHENVHNRQARKQNYPVWCLYPPDLAYVAGIRYIKSWDAADSLVDWLDTFLQLADPAAALQIDEISDTDDIRYTFYFQSTDTGETPHTIAQHLSIDEQVYAFIKQYAPVRTKVIQERFFEQDDGTRRKLFRILKRLEKAGKIEKIRQGVYVPVQKCVE